MGAFMESFDKDLAESGELVDARGLTAPVHTRRIRLREGVPVVTDGPYAETEEVLAGYWIVECDSFDRATEIASRLTDAPARSTVRSRAIVDVRPLADSRDELESDACRRPSPRTCCASWPRRSSARWCGGTGTSTPPKTRSRRRCWRRPPSGPPRGSPPAHAAG